MIVAVVLLLFILFDGSITMYPDKEGFLYPKIQQGRCFNCSFCLKVCKDVKYYDSPQKIYPGWDNKEENRAISSSGGIFSSLSKKVLNQDGHICVVGYTKDKIF